MPSLNELRQFEARALGGTQGMWGEDVLAALYALYANTGNEHLSGMLSNVQGGSFQQFMLNGLFLPTWDFTAGGGLPAGMTCTRASIGTWTGPDGVLRVAQANQPRFDWTYSPQFGMQGAGLLVEEARTNLFINSNALNSPGWVQFNASTVEAQGPVAPIQLNKVNEDATNTEHGVLQTVTISAGSTLTATAYARRGERSWLRIRVIDSPGFVNFYSSYFDLTNGVLGSQQTGGAATLTSRAITPVGDGVYRCEVTVRLDGTSVAARVDNFLQTADLQSTYAGTPGNGLFLGAMQIEAGAFPTSYIPTAGSAVTRNGDVISMPTASIPGFSATAGTMFVEALPALGNLGLTQGLAVFSDATANNRIGLFRSGSSGDLLPRVVTGGVAANPPDVPTMPANTVARAALAWAVGNAAATRGGVPVTTSAPAGLPAVTALQLAGNEPGTGLFLNGHLRRFGYLPLRLPDAALQRLTAPGP